MSARDRRKSIDVGRGCRRGLRSQVEVAAILGISPQAVYEGEQRALRKLAGHPKMRELAEEYGLPVARG